MCTGTQSRGVGWGGEQGGAEERGGCWLLSCPASWEPLLPQPPDAGLRYAPAAPHFPLSQPLRTPLLPHFLLAAGLCLLGTLASSP